MIRTVKQYEGAHIGIGDKVYAVFGNDKIELN